MSRQIGIDCLPRGVYVGGGGGEDMARLLREVPGSVDELRRRVRSGWSLRDSSIWLSWLVLERCNSGGGGANEIDASLATAGSGCENGEAMSRPQTGDGASGRGSSSASSRADGRGDEDGDNSGSLASEGLSTNISGHPTNHGTPFVQAGIPL